MKICHTRSLVSNRATKLPSTQQRQGRLFLLPVAAAGVSQPVSVVAPGPELDCAGCKKQTGDVAPETWRHAHHGWIVRPFVRALGMVCNYVKPENVHRK